MAIDGEVAEFMLWPIYRIAELVCNTFEFKFNCNLVIIDFLLRHGILSPANEPNYVEICQGLYGGAAR